MKNNNLSEEQIGNLVAMGTCEAAIDPKFENNLRNWLLQQTLRPEVKPRTQPLFARAELWFAVGAVAALALIGYGLWLPTVLDFTH